MFLTKCDFEDLDDAWLLTVGRYSGSVGESLRSFGEKAVFHSEYSEQKE